MGQYIIVICIISILLWYYYSKYKDHDDKYIPVMVRQSELMHENEVLKKENKKLKLRLKYLENYKNDVSKTFKILDNELGLINEHIKKRGWVPNNQEGEQVNPDMMEDSVPQETPSSTPSSTQPRNMPLNFQTSFTPSMLNTLLQDSQESSDNVFNNIFNRFLTGDMNFTSNIPETQVSSELHNSRESQNTQNTQNTQETEVNNEMIENQAQEQSSLSEQNTQDEHQASNDTRPLSEVHFSVNYLPLNSSYRQFLIRRDT